MSFLWVQPTDLGQTNLVQHRIDTGDTKPIKQSARRLPRFKLDEATKVVEEMYQQGVIEPSILVLVITGSTNA